MMDGLSNIFKKYPKHLVFYTNMKTNVYSFNIA